MMFKQVLFNDFESMFLQKLGWIVKIKANVSKTTLVLILMIQPWRLGGRACGLITDLSLYWLNYW